MKKFSEIRPRDDVIRPVLQFAGGPKGLGAVTAAATFLPAYWLFSKISKKGGMPDWRRRAAIVAGLTSIGTGLGSYALSQRRDGGTYQNGKDFADTILGGPEGADVKIGSELDFSFNKGTLMQGVDEMPITNSQRDFLNDGIKFAPGKSATTLWGLSEGFGQATEDRAGGLLPHITRAIEGSIIGGAFGALAGLSPTDRKWAAGVGAVLNSLKGSQLFNTIGEIL